MAGKRTQQKEATRTKLIESAIKLYAERGILATKTLDVAKEAHVSHGALFVHFPTQEDLWASVIQTVGHKINRRLHELAEGQASFKDVLVAHIKGLMTYEALYTRLVIENRLLPEKVRHIYHSIQSTISFHIAEVLERTVASNLIQTYPPHLIFNGWVGLLHHYLTNNDVFSPGESVLKRYGQELADFYSSLILRKRSDSNCEQVE
ncbi:MAG: TetR/AcrR family transcriptional regulator [Clostridia bacterium]|nr:TetR/AcrR family transcriptional regulator [Clostridia bacterium]